MERESTKKEKVQGIIIIIMAIIIVFGCAYFASELKYCKVEEIKKVELTSIEMKEFRNLLKGESLSLIYLARPDCKHCQHQEPIMKEISGKYNLTVNYLNTNNLQNEDFYEIVALDTNLFGVDGKEFGTPTMLLVQNGKIVDSLIGYNAQEAVENFLAKHNMIQQ